MFALLQRRLIDHLSLMIRSGELTERGLARRLNASQPYIHNILKGIRSPSPAFCDHIIEILHIPMEALLRPEDLAGIRKRPALALFADDREGQVPAAARRR